MEKGVASDPSTGVVATLPDLHSTVAADSLALKPLEIDRQDGRFINAERFPPSKKPPPPLAQRTLHVDIALHQAGVAHAPEFEVDFRGLDRELEQQLHVDHVTRDGLGGRWQRDPTFDGKLLLTPCPVATLRQQIRDAAPGATIDVAPGEYVLHKYRVHAHGRRGQPVENGPLLLDKAVTLACGDQVLLAANGNFPCVRVSAPGVAIEGCSVHAWASGAETRVERLPRQAAGVKAVEVVGQGGATISRCECVGQVCVDGESAVAKLRDQTLVHHSHGAGVYLWEGELVADGATVCDNEGSGIELGNRKLGARARIERCYIGQNGGNGVVVYGASSNCVLRTCHIEQNARFGVIAYPLGAKLVGRAGRLPPGLSHDGRTSVEGCALEQNGRGECVGNLTQAAESQSVPESAV